MLPRTLSEPYIVKNGEMYGCTNVEGKECIPCVYEAMSIIQDGTFSAKKDGKWGIIDSKGKTICKFEYTDMETFAKGIVKVEKNGKYGCIGFSGKEILPCVYDAIYLTDNDEKVIAVLSQGDKYGIFNVKTLKFTGCEYDIFGKFKDISSTSIQSIYWE